MTLMFHHICKSLPLTHLFVGIPRDCGRVAQRLQADVHVTCDVELARVQELVLLHGGAHFCPAPVELEGGACMAHGRHGAYR